MNRFAVPLLALLVPAFARAETVHAVLEGQSLKLDLPCVSSVSISADPGLAGKAVIDATAANKGELDSLTLSGGSKATVEISHECWRPIGFAGLTPTLAVAIHVPPGFAVGVDASGDGSYAITAGGALSLDSSGSATVEAGALPARCRRMSAGRAMCG